MVNRRKISIIGAGHTGGTLAFILAQKELAEIVLIERQQSEGMAKGKALDILESGSIWGFDTPIHGSVNIEDIKDSDVVVMTAGIPRKSGMTREDLVQTNEQIVRETALQIATYAPQSIIIVLTNPVDAMTYIAFKASGFPKERIIGQSGILDAARYRTFIAQELNVSVKDVSGFVLGGHGDTMLPLVNTTHINGIPVKHLISKEKIDQIVERTREGGSEIIALLDQGSAYYAPATAIYETIDAIFNDRKRLLPSIAYLEGEYGCSDICFGVPTIIGYQGIEKIIEIDMNNDEYQQLQHSAQAVSEVKNSLKFK